VKFNDATLIYPRNVGGPIATRNTNDVGNTALGVAKMGSVILTQP
jgi:hypothetical protein